jgi:hypothetical protein
MTGVENTPGTGEARAARGFETRITTEEVTAVGLMMELRGNKLSPVLLMVPGRFVFLRPVVCLAVVETIRNSITTM